MANLQCNNQIVFKNSSGRTVHLGRLRTLEVELEEYVLASIKDPHVLRSLAHLLFCWVSDCFSWIGHKIQKTPSVRSNSESMHRRIRLCGPTVCFIFVFNTLIQLAKPLEWFGDRLEHCLNVIHANGGLKQTLLRHLFNREALRRPSQGDDNYFSIIGLLDNRQDLRIQRDSRDEVPNLDSAESIQLTADLCMMASKLAYENDKVIERVVNCQWKMNFVKFFDCWNEYLESNTTQGYIFTDKAQDANAIVLAFRGTEPFNIYDWCTDFDFSYYVLPEMGKVHVGFLEALGLGNRLKTETLKLVKYNSALKASGKTPSASPSSGLPKRVQDDEKKVLAYDAICCKIRALLRENLGAKLYITGHSLGGALAALFTGVLLSEWDPIMDSLGGVFTFGQPRVGDADFAKYMEKHLCSPKNRKYFRMVFRNDVVTRMPCDNNVLKFKHFGLCHYYSSISEGKALQEEPQKNLYSLVFMPIFHWHAIQELFESLFKTFFNNKTNQDHMETGLCLLLLRFGALLIPGTCAHSPTHYVNAIRSAPATFLQLEGIQMP